MQRKLKLNKIYTLKEDNTKRWRNGAEKDLTHLKKVISECLKEGDYILIHANYFTMNKIYGYAKTKQLTPIFLSEKWELEIPVITIDQEEWKKFIEKMKKKFKKKK